jgi:THO complex subunit 7
LLQWHTKLDYLYFLANEHENLRGQIEQLKTSLEHAQTLRKRKIEYDGIAEKINALPSRDELNL